MVVIREEMTVEENLKIILLEQAERYERMIKGNNGLGSTKHGKSGHVHNSKHFTGKKRGKRIRRKNPKKK